MIVLGIIALAALGLIAMSGRTRQADANLASADQALALARARAQALGIPGGHWEGARWVEDTPAPAREGSPPGLLLKREPEIRRMGAEQLADYVTTIRNWLGGAWQGSEWRGATNTPTEAWWESFVNAQSEVLLRVTRRTDALTDAQVNALFAWLTVLQSKGMPLTTDERALFINLGEEWRHRNLGTVSGADDEHSRYAEEEDEADALLRVQAEALEAEGLHRTR